MTEAEKMCLFHLLDQLEHQIERYCDEEKTDYPGCHSNLTPIHIPINCDCGLVSFNERNKKHIDKIKEVIETVFNQHEEEDRMGFR